MPDPNHPNTLGILNAIKAQQQSVQVDESPAYTLVKLGSLGDTIDQAPWCTIEMLKGTSSHYAAGGRVDEKPVVRVTSGMPLTDTSEVETTLVTIRDAMIPLYQTHSTLSGTQNVYTLIIVPDSETWAYIRANGVWHRVYMVDIQVSMQYQLALGVID